MLIIDVVESGSQFNRYYFNEGEYSIGKDPSCDIYLDNSFASRKHAILAVYSNVAYLKDNKSTNGILVNGSKVQDYHKIAQGDEFVISTIKLYVNTVPDTEEEVGVQQSVVVDGAEEQTEVSQGQEFTPSLNTANLLSNEYSDVFWAAKRRLHKQIMDYLDTHKRNLIHYMSSDELREEARIAAVEVLEKDVHALPESINRGQLIEEVVAESVGLGVLEPFLQDEAISEIMVNGANQIYIETKGRLLLTKQKFSSDAALRGIIERIVSPLGRRIDEGSPMVDARLEDGSRINAIIPPLSLTGPILTIRKFGKQNLSASILEQNGTLDNNMSLFLQECVRSKRNIIISGGTGSGKTTTLNILSNYICEDERIITIEDAAELKLNQTHVVSLESRPENAEGRGYVGIRELVINSLRMRPDRIVVGECRGGEALDMLQAMNTGHDGSMTTGHANTPRDFLARLEVMVMMADIDLPSRAIREQIASAIDIIIQQARFSDGSRKITDIVEVCGIDGEVIILQPLFSYHKVGVDSKGKVLGYHSGLGYLPKFYEDMIATGSKLSVDIFNIVSPEKMVDSEDSKDDDGLSSKV